MGLFKFLIDKLNSDEKINVERYYSAKKVFIFFSFLFSVSFYFVGAGYNDSFFISLFTYSYVLTLFSLLFFLYFAIKVKLYGYFSGVAFLAIFLLLGVILLFFLKFVS